jgi:hypothetical protein
MSFLASLLLESPAPPPNWLPTPTERRSRARVVVQGMLARGRQHRSWHKGHYLHDLGRTYPLFSASRIVTADEIGDAVDTSLLHLNPPVYQGWAVGFAILALAALLVALSGAAPGADVRVLPLGLLGVLASIALWIVVEIAIGSRTIELEICEHGVALRRWLDVWLDRPGQVIDEPTQLSAAFGPNHVVLSGSFGEADVSLNLWPPSARVALPDDLEAWGVKVDRHDGPHHRRHH